MKRTFLVASCKPWGEVTFESLKTSFPGDTWIYVSDRESLLSVSSSTVIDKIFFVHWNWLVPESLTSKVECLCLHMTDLPYGRGGSPLQNLILRGHKETVLSVFRMESSLDSGPIYLKEPFALHGSAHEIYIRMSNQAGLMFKTILDLDLMPTHQVGNPVYFQRRKPQQSQIPLRTSLEALFDFIRMLDAPTYPHAFLEYGNLRVEFRDACFVDGTFTASVSISELKSGDYGGQR
jgi:methionyl-tRNA formyltransferase